MPDDNNQAISVWITPIIDVSRIINRRDAKFFTNNFSPTEILRLFSLDSSSSYIRVCSGITSTRYT